MKKSDKTNVALAVALTAVLGGSVALTTVDIKDPEDTTAAESPVDRKIFDPSMLRKAWLLGTCVEQSDLSMCKLTWDRRGYCVCLTREPAMLPNEVEKVNINAGSKWKMRVCRPLPGNEGGIIVRIQNPEDGIPDGYQCTLIATGLLDSTSIVSLKNTLEEELEKACGWPVSGGSWSCCPICVVWDDGCPPCQDLCKYWDSWVGHESECNGGLP